MLNVCACGAVIYQKHRVRQREDNLRRRIKRFSDAGMIHTEATTASASNPESAVASKYCVSNDQPVCNHDDSEASEASEACSEAINEDNKVYVISTHHHLPYAQPLQRLPRLPMMNVSYDDHSVSNTSSLTRDLRYSSRSMGNNLDSLHVNNASSNSRSIAALDVLPRNTSNTNVIYHNTQDVPITAKRTSILPHLEPPSLCHSLRRFANGSTTGSSASGSRPPSPIIEVIPVSEYEHLYGGINSPMYTNQYPPTVPPSNVVYPIYNRTSMSSTLPPMSASTPASSGLRHIDYAPRGNFATTNKPLRPPPLLQQQQPQPLQPSPNTSVSYWKSGTLQHQPPRPLLHQPQRPMLPPNLGLQASYSRQQGQS